MTVAANSAPKLEAASLTADQVIQALAAGCTIVLSDQTEFSMPDAAERQALAYFLPGNPGRHYVGSPLQRGSEDVARAVLAWTGKTFVPPSAPETKTSGAGTVWRIKQVSITAFGGLHPYCTASGDAPAPLLLDTTAPVVLVQGNNGAGKSSIAKAVTFALTGKVPVAVGEPTAFNSDDLINTYTLPDGKAVPLPSIVPMPEAGQHEACTSERGLKIHTKVAVTFEDGAGAERTVQRSVIATSGKGSRLTFRDLLEIDGGLAMESLASSLNTTELALELSTIHLARLPSIRLGQKEALGGAVQQLTGLSAIGKLEETSSKLEKYLSGTFSATSVNKQRAAEDAYAQASASLAKCFEESKTPPPKALSLSGGAAACQARLEEIEKDLNDRSTKVKEAVAAAAGVTADEVELSGLAEALKTARTTILGAEASPKTAMASIDGLAAVEQTAIDQLRSQIKASIDRANDCAVRSRDKKQAVRRQLYAQVASWLKDNGDDAQGDGCPVCLRPLDEDVHDHDLGQTVAGAIAQARRDDAEIGLSLSKFLEKAAQDLLAGMPASLKQEQASIGSELHISPGESWATSIVAETTRKVVKSPVVTALIDQARARVLEQAKALPVLQTSPPPTLEPELSDTSFQKAVRAALDLIDLTIWAGKTKNAREEIRRKCLLAEDSEDAPTDACRSLVAEIDVLKGHLADAAPVTQAQAWLKQLQTHRNAWAKEQADQQAAAAAATAFGGLKKLRDVIDRQVEGLMFDLRDRTEELWQQFYDRNASGAGPRLSALEHDDGALTAMAEKAGVTGPALHITNSSQLRAYLFAFVLALTERIHGQSGGLRTILMDDPQTLFDEVNQKRLAKELVAITRDGFHPLILTFDDAFASRIARAGNLRPDAALSPEVGRYRLNPRSTINSGSCSSIERHQDQLTRKQDAWRLSPTADVTIKEFCNEARIQLEQFLRGMLDDMGEPVFDRPALGLLHNRFATAIKRHRYRLAAYEQFKELSVRLGSLSPDAQDGLNWSHHFSADDLREHHAKAVHEALERVLPLVEQCRAVLDGRRLVSEAANTNALPTAVNSTVSIPVVPGQLAAAEDGQNACGEGHPGDETVIIDPVRHVGFALGAASRLLPPALGMDSVVVCEPLDGTHDRKRMLAVRHRRMGNLQIGWADIDIQSGQVTLFGTPGNSVNAFRLDEVDLFRCCGVLLGVAQGVKKPCEPYDLTHFLSRKTLNGIEVTMGDSAVPVAFEGDIVLVRPEIPLTDLDSAQGDIFAFRLGDGSKLLKRLDRSGSTSSHRLLLPLGDQGSGRSLARAAASGSADLIEAVWPVAGFWWR